MTPPDSLETARLVLRKPRLDDAPLIFRIYGQDPEVTRYLMWQPHQDVQDAQAAVKRFLSGWELGTQLCWLIFARETADLARLHRREERREWSQSRIPAGSLSLGPRLYGRSDHGCGWLGLQRSVRFPSLGGLRR